MVDLLRSCYVRQYDFGDGVLRNVRWFWAEPGAKLLPYYTIFASGVWHNGDDYSGYGEKATKRIWYNGKNWLNYQGQCNMGTADQWANGLTPAELAAPVFAPACCTPAPNVNAVGGRQLGGAALVGAAAIIFAAGGRQLGGAGLVGTSYTAWSAGGRQLGGAGLVGRLGLGWAAGGRQLGGQAVSGPLGEGWAAGGRQLGGSGTGTIGGPPYTGCSYYSSGAGPKYVVTASGFSGTCATFNGTWTLPTPSSGCIWYYSAPPISVGLNLGAGGSATLQFYGGTYNATYTVSSGWLPLGTNTANHQSSSCGSGSAPATVTIAASH